MSALLICPLSFGVELISNGDFENGDDGSWIWNKRALITDQYTAQSGSFVATAAEPHSSFLLTHDLITVEPGSPIQSSVWIKAANLEKPAFAQLIFYHSDDLATPVKISTFARTLSTTNEEWQQFTRYLITPANANRMKVKLRSPVSDSGYAHFDNVEISQTVFSRVLTENGDFEDISNTAWDLGKKSSITDEQANRGNYSAKITPAGEFGALFQRNIPVVEGKPIYVSGWLKIDGFESNKNALISVRFIDTDVTGEFSGSEDSPETIKNVNVVKMNSTFNNDWQSFGQMIAAPADADLMEVRLQTQASATGSVYFDQIEASMESEFPMAKMIPIVGGSFEMGCSPNQNVCGSEAIPRHRVTVPSFYMGETEVTFEEYDFYCNQVDHCELPDDEGWGRGTRPVINVSRGEILNYIDWLNGQTGRTFRLPSDAEWEYAARAGTTTVFPWGDEPSGLHANAHDDEGYNTWPSDGFPPIENDRYSGLFGHTSPVRSYPANAWGLYDMIGNVAELVADVVPMEGGYEGAPTDGSVWDVSLSPDYVSNNPAYPYFGWDLPRRSGVIRGGAFNGGVDVTSSSSRWYRGYASSAVKTSSTGFRLAEDFPKLPDMVRIEGGQFEMGCSPNDTECEDSELPRRTVNVQTFSIAATEVTKGQYVFYCKRVGCRLPDGLRNTEEFNYSSYYSQLPVTSISWDEAKAYISWLNQQTGGNYRLPTEAEWEFAARAGSTTRYYWGDDPSHVHANGGSYEDWDPNFIADNPDFINELNWPKDGYPLKTPYASDEHGYPLANVPAPVDVDHYSGYVGNIDNVTAAVGSFAPNAWGLYDMIGNAQEWVEDTYSTSYEGLPADGSAYYSDRLNENHQKVVRGGSAFSSQQELRSSARLSVNVSYRRAGIRLAQDVPENN